MTDWVDVCADTALGKGEHIVVTIDGTEIAVFNLDGQFYAIENVCSHDSAEIASGELEGDEIVCPRHGARFCIKTGEVRTAPAYDDIDIFPVLVENGRLQVRDNRWD